jgi:calcium/proton exchanger
LGKQTVDINVDMAGILTSLMIISSATLIMPSALDATDNHAHVASDGPSGYILTLSHFTSIILLVFYLMYLWFKTQSHAHLFRECNEEGEDGDEVGQLGLVTSLVVLLAATLGVGVCSDYLVDSVDGFVEAIGISRAFIGLIIVPIVGNAGEFVGTVQWARSGKINLAVGVIVESTLQISLFVTPFLVLVGWIIGKHMSLQFDAFETIVLAVSVLVVNGLVRDGRTNYFEGFLLVGTYVYLRALLCPAIF